MRHLMTLAAALSVAVPSTTFADVPGKTWILAKRATAILQQRGYRVTKIEADDGHWEGDAVKGGQTYDFHVDPHTGRITKLERDRD